MLADALNLPPDTVRRVLTDEDLARIDAYVGGGVELHELPGAGARDRHGPPRRCL